MISVIVYGRNDSYSYNLHKRAAISLNCIAEVLTHPGDEIIFVDCNTPEELPTFPEAIQDTLTPRAREFLRILRLRPRLYQKYSRGSPLKVLEPLSRNIAIRRHNSSNRWILSTNTDMVFIPRDPQRSLSDIAAGLADGFYELPRFEVPELLWEAVDRTRPIEIIQDFRRMGKRLHLNEVIESEPHIRFDGPGDFQLMLRDQICAIHGFNEEMIWGWHVDSNLCRRLYLLNGKTESLLDYVFAYHCHHTRQPTTQHVIAHTQNDLSRFVHSVSSPFIPAQAETWGIPHEEIEEIRLTTKSSGHFHAALEELLPGAAEEMIWNTFTPATFNRDLIYDTHHVLPFLANHLATIAPHTNVGYCGGNTELIRLMTQFLQRCGHQARVLVDTGPLSIACSPGQAELPPECKLVDTDQLAAEADIFVFDAGIMHLLPEDNVGQNPSPKSGEDITHFNEELGKSFSTCVKAEASRLRSERGAPRKFIFVGSGHTWLDTPTMQSIGIVFSPYSTHVRHGYLLPYLFQQGKTRRIITQKIVRWGLKSRDIIRKIPGVSSVANRIYIRLVMATDKKRTHQ